MIAAGRGAPSAISSKRWNSAVGALPIPTTAPARSVHPERDSGSRSCRSPALCQLARLRVVDQASDLVVCWEAPPGDPGSKHLCVGEDHRSSLERRPGGGYESWMEGKIIDEIDIAAGVNHPNCDRTHVLGQPGEIGLRANRRKRSPVDLCQAP